MSSIELLKQELIAQKALIESKSGVVQVAGTNPSPFEITAGIKSIPLNDVSDATATVSDVSFGKTFYAGDHKIKTGTAVNNQQAVDALFMSPLTERIYDDEIYYSFPDYVYELRGNHFYENYNSVTIVFNEDVEILGDYAFYKTPNFKYQNYEDIKALKKIGAYCFAYGSTEGLEIGNLPETLTYLGSYAFYYNGREGMDIKIPAGLVSFGQYTFMQESRKIQNSLDLTELTYTTLPGYSFYFNVFNCDIIVPSGVKTIGTYFNYNGSCKNVYLPSTVENVGNYCFGSLSSASVDNFILQTFTIDREVPPSFGKNVIALQNLQHEFKFYVPDNSVDEYKNVANLANYVNYIFPMSQRD